MEVYMKMCNFLMLNSCLLVIDVLIWYKETDIIFQNSTPNGKKGDTIKNMGIYASKAARSTYVV